MEFCVYVVFCSIVLGMHLLRPLSVEAGVNWDFVVFIVMAN
jgi:hypothetical protein